MKLIAAMLAGAAVAQTQEMKDKYPRWSTEMDHYGYTWDAFEITTDDDYILTTFRITGKTDGPIEVTKDALLIMHGHTQDAASWIRDYHVSPSK